MKNYIVNVEGGEDINTPFLIEGVISDILKHESMHNRESALHNCIISVQEVIEEEDDGYEFYQ